MAKKRAGAPDDELLRPLYEASPKSFVAERARVAAALKAAGRGDEARALAKWKRPSASVWAVNELARQAAGDVEELLAMGASLRAGERAVLRGGDAAGFLEEARRARQKVAALARRAEKIVEESGQKATVTLGRKIAATLQAASLGDDETRARLQAGRLEEDLTPPSSVGGAIAGVHAGGGGAADGGDLSAALAASLGGAAQRKGTAASAHAHGKHATHGGGKHAAHGAYKHAAHGGGKHAAHGGGKHAAHARKDRAADERARAADERARAADERARAAHERARAAAERKRAAAERRDQRRAQAAARKHAATLARAATAAERVVAERQRAVERGRAAVEEAESALRGAKDALAEAELAAAAARRAADTAADRSR